MFKKFIGRNTCLKETRDRVFRLHDELLTPLKGEKQKKTKTRVVDYLSF